MADQADRREQMHRLRRQRRRALGAIERQYSWRVAWIAGA